jgi:hypothetical protein
MGLKMLIMKSAKGVCIIHADVPSIFAGGSNIIVCFAKSSIPVTSNPALAPQVFLIQRLIGNPQQLDRSHRSRATLVQYPENLESRSLSFLLNDLPLAPENPQAAQGIALGLEHDAPLAPGHAEYQAQQVGRDVQR